MTEHQIQVQTAAFLDRALPPEVVWFAVPNGGKRHVSVAKKLKAEGVKKGVADLLFFWADLVLAVEMKTAKGRQSKSQKEWAKRWRSNSRHYVICRSLDDVYRVLCDFGFPLKMRLI